MKFFQWYVTKEEELTGDDPIYIYAFGLNHGDREVYNYLEISKSFRKVSVFVNLKDSGLVKRWIDSRLNSETVVLCDEDIFEKISIIQQKKIIEGVFRG